MKKLLVLAIAAVLVLGLAAVTMAEAAFSGEIQTGYVSYQKDGGDALSAPYFFGKMTLSGKLGDDLTGTLVFRDGDAGLADGDVDTLLTNNSTFAVDEADVVFTESFGTLKFGYYGWNNNYKDIVGSMRDDVKSYFTSSGSFTVAEGFKLGVAYAYNGTDNAGEDVDARYGVDFGYATDTLGVDVIYTNTYNGAGKADDDTVMGVNASYKLDAFKVYLQYETATDKTLAEDPTNTVIGATYDSDSIYGRFEYDLSKQDGIDAENPMGIRLGYKLADGAKIEFQNAVDNAKTTTSYIKLICAF